MGGQVVMETVRRMALRGNSGALSKLKDNVLISPDVNNVRGVATLYTVGGEAASSTIARAQFWRGRMSPFDPCWARKRWSYVDPCPSELGTSLLAFFLK